MGRKSRKAFRRAQRAVNPVAVALRPPARADYDAIASQKKRFVPIAVSAGEDDELTPRKRKQLQAVARNQLRNFELLPWMIRKVLDYNTSFAFQSRSGDEGFDKELEALVKNYSTAENFDITGRMDRNTFLRTLEACRIADGDAAGLFLTCGHSQGIEGTRICNPSSGVPEKLDISEFKHGVRRNKPGRALEYIICRRDGRSLIYDIRAKAANINLHTSYRRFDQGRGVSDLAGVFNHSQDLYESTDANAVKAKLVALAGLIIKRALHEGKMPFQPPAVELDDEGNPISAEDSESEERSEYDVNISAKKPFLLDMDPGDELDVVESRTPPAEFVNFSNHLIRMILLALDIPYTFYDQTRGSYTIQKDAWTQWELASEHRRKRNRDWLDRWLVWKLRRAIASRELTLPAGLSLDKPFWSWQCAGRPWMDIKELSIDIEAIRMGLECPQDVLARRGKDPVEVLDKLAQYYQMMKDRKLPTVAWDEGMGLTIQETNVNGND